jgi:2-phosphosulfolactate phosphatase
MSEKQPAMKQAPLLDIILSANEMDEGQLKGRLVVVIDILRASSTMITALSNGATKIYPVEETDQAFRLVQNMERKQVLTLGERNGVMIEGFDYGNSPLSCTSEVVGGKQLIMTTTNGTRALEYSKGAKEILVGGFLNYTAILGRVEGALKNQIPVTLFCAGWRGRPALEDTLFAGMVLNALIERGNPSLEPLSDAGHMAICLAQNLDGEAPIGLVKQSDHARRLAGRVGEDEIEACCFMDAHPVLPFMQDGTIELSKQ